MWKVNARSVRWPNNPPVGKSAPKDSAPGMDFTRSNMARSPAEKHHDPWAPEESKVWTIDSSVVAQVRTVLADSPFGISSVGSRAPLALDPMNIDIIRLI